MVISRNGSIRYKQKEMRIKSMCFTIKINRTKKEGNKKGNEAQKFTI